MWVSRHRHARRAWEEGGERSGKEKGGVRRSPRPSGQAAPRQRPLAAEPAAMPVEHGGRPHQPVGRRVFASPVWLRAAGTAGGRRRAG